MYVCMYVCMYVFKWYDRIAFSVQLKVFDEMSFLWCCFFSGEFRFPKSEPHAIYIWTMLKHQDLGDEIRTSPSHPIWIGVSRVSHVQNLDLQAEAWPSHFAHDKTEDCRGPAVGHAERCFLELAWICFDFHAWTQPLDDTALLLKSKLRRTDGTPDAKPPISNVPF